MLWWHVFIGPAAETQCGGICLLDGERLTAVSPHCRRSSGIVVHFIRARAKEEECCQIPLTEHVPKGLPVT